MAALRGLLCRFRSEAGAELIEFGLTLPLLLLVVLGIVEFGFLFREYEIVTNAAREGARIAVLPAYSTTDAQERVDSYLTASGLDADLAPTPTVTPGSVALPGGTCVSTVAVTVTYPHAMTFVAGIASYFGATFGTVNLTATSTMRSETAAVGCP
jgi:Flp pilus assembly protein TadG